MTVLGLDLAEGLCREKGMAMASGSVSNGGFRGNQHPLCCLAVTVGDNLL